MRAWKIKVLLGVLSALMLTPGSGACSTGKHVRPLLTERDLPNCVRAPGVYHISDCTIRAELVRKLLCSAKRLDLQDVDILGDLWLTDQEVGAELSATLAHFEGDVTFEGVRFLKDVRFENCTFSRTTNLTRCVFERAVFLLCKWADGGQEATGAARGWAAFRDAVFRGPVSFDGTVLPASDFRGVRCAGLADFSNVEFPWGANFVGASFGGVAVFDDAILSGSDIVFWNAAFAQTASFQRMGAKGGPGAARFGGATFKDRAYFNDAHLLTLDFRTDIHAPRPRGPVATLFFRPSAGPTVFRGPVWFDGIVCGRADFTEAEFHDCASFCDAEFREAALFDGALFRAEVDFTRAEFPTAEGATRTETRYGIEMLPCGLGLDRTYFGGPVLMSCSQLFRSRSMWRIWRDPSPKLLDAKAETWGVLERAFDNADYLPGKCEASYQRRLLAGGASGGRTAPLLDVLSRRFWGYGFRPWRLMGWTSLVFLAFTFAYWTQTKPLAREKAEWAGRWRRIRYAFLFSLNTCCPWKPGYGYQRSLTPGFRAITSVQYVVVLVLLLCLMYVLSNTNPVMKMLASKLLGL